MYDLILERLDGNDLVLPSFGTVGSAAFDFSACLTRPAQLVTKAGKREQFIFDISLDGHRHFFTGDQPAIRHDVTPSLYMNPGEIILVSTGFKVQLDQKCVMKLYIRSSSGIKGLVLANQVGIIDSDYRGEVFMAIKNASEKVLLVSHGDRLVQATLEEIIRPVMIEGRVGITERAGGGFGSTGTNL